MYAVYTNTYYYYLIYFPDTSGYTPIELQELFEEWLNDETIDHDCWVYIDGEKYGLSYDKDDFVKWLNENIFSNSKDKVKVIEENLKTIPPGLPVLYY